MVCQERAPALRGRFLMTHHVLGNRGLGLFEDDSRQADQLARMGISSLLGSRLCQVVWVSRKSHGRDSHEHSEACCGFLFAHLGIKATLLQLRICKQTVLFPGIPWG